MGNIVLDKIYVHKRDGELIMVSKYTILVLLGFLVGCCSPPAANPHPSNDLSELVERAVHNWLDVRVDEDSFVIIYDDNAGWKNAEDSKAVADWFEANLGVPEGNIAYWDFNQLDNDIRDSEMYNKGPPSDTVYVLMLIVAIASYKDIYLEGLQ